MAGAGKLALNMVSLATNALPRCGALEFLAAGEVSRPAITVRGKGPMIILDETALSALVSGCRRDSEAIRDMNARFVQPYLTGILAADFSLTAAKEALGLNAREHGF